MKAQQCHCILLMLAYLSLPTSSFNLEPREAIIISEPSSSKGPVTRGSYFGFSVAFHLDVRDGSAWLVVGAPRANSSYYNPERITEPGTIFKCDLRSHECEELFIDQAGNDVAHTQNYEFQYQDLKNRGWLGAALDSQPTHKDRQTVAVCAPRWKNQLYVDTYLMNGACYWLNSSLPNSSAHKMIPLVQYSKQTYTIRDRALFYYSHGGAGLSIHYPENSMELLVGAPGVFNWQGTVIRFKDAGPPPTGNISRRRRRRQSRVSENQMFASYEVPNPYHTATIKDFDLFGYAVASGKFTSRDEILYAGGAPRGANSLGKVIIFSFPPFEEMSLDVYYEWVGVQIGENFGAALVATDINGDGFSDLVVGAPMYSTDEAIDMGRIVVYRSRPIDLSEAELEASENLHGLGKANARFGTTLAACGDLNQDGYQDVAVGAPYEDGHGAVYIYLGSPTGLRSKFSQHLQPHQFSAPLSGFGMAISRGVDVDSSGYPDLAIGSFLSGHAAVLRSRPVANVRGYVSTFPSTIALNASSLDITACVDYYGKNVPQTFGINGNISLDYEFFPPRAYFTDTNTFLKSFQVRGSTTERRCQEYTVKLKADKIDPQKPIIIKVDWELDHSQTQNLMLQPLTDPSEFHSVRERVGIITGCEDDGDKTCRVDMIVETSLSSQNTKFVIGSDDKPSVTVSVFNTGEPAFLPNVTVSVDPPLALNLPSTHVCDFPSKDNRTLFWCRLKNPIMASDKDEVTFTIDLSELNDRASSTSIRVEVSGDGVEARPNDNIFAQNLNMEAKATLKLHGSSKEEQILYQRTEEDKINVTTTPEFKHIFSLAKTGPTPLGEVLLEVYIPVNITSRGKTYTFLNLYSPQRNFQNQGYACRVQGATFIVEDEDNGESSIIPNLEAGNGSLTAREKRQQQQTQQQQNQEQSTRISGTEISNEPTSLNCTNPMVKCARLTCSIKSWPASTSFAELTIKMSLNLTILAGHISAQGGAIIKSQAKAWIDSLNPDLDFNGDKQADIMVVTQIQPDSLPGKGVAWWIILLAILAGILVLCLVAYALHKAGFFKRKEKEAMKAHRAQVESSQGGKDNAGLVGD